MLRTLRTGKSPSGSFTIYQSDEGWLGVHLMTADHRLHVRQARTSDADYNKVLNAIGLGYEYDSGFDSLRLLDDEKRVIASDTYNAFDALSVE